MFAVAIDASPSMIFFDEIDSLLSSKKGDGSEHEASRRFKTEWMQQVSGITSNNDSDVSHRVLVPKEQGGLILPPPHYPHRWGAGAR